MRPDLLRQLLSRLDGKGYKAYKEIRGGYQFDRFELHIDHVQGDPYTAPTKVRVRVPRDLAGFPKELHHTRVRTITLEDFIGRRVRSEISRLVKVTAVLERAGASLLMPGARRWPQPPIDFVP